MGELRTRSARHQGGPVQRGARLLHRFRSEHLRFRLEPHGPGHETRKAQNLKVGTIDRQYRKAVVTDPRNRASQGCGRTDNTTDVRLEVTDSFLLLLEIVPGKNPL